MRSNPRTSPDERGVPEALFNGKRVREFQAFAQQAERRLQILDSATSPQDLAGLPSNHFEALMGNRKDQYSIRINQQWRICINDSRRSRR